jgi:hypothetical protein
MQAVTYCSCRDLPVAKGHSQAGGKVLNIPEENEPAESFVQIV